MMDTFTSLLDTGISSGRGGPSGPTVAGAHGALFSSQVTIGITLKP